MYLSAAPWTAPCGPTDWSSLFQGQQGTRRSLARLWQERRPGQMGQQMDKEAEPLICSTRKRWVWPHPESRGRAREAERETQTLGCTVKRYRQRYKKEENQRGWLHPSVYILTTILFTVTPDRAANKRLRANLCLATWSNELFTAAREKKFFFFKKHTLVTEGRINYCLAEW